jgi:hypothetical protein
MGNYGEDDNTAGAVKIMTAMSVLTVPRQKS